MTTEQAPPETASPATALLVIDMQNDVVGEAFERDRTVATINELVLRARSAGTPVVWVQHSNAGMERDSEGWQIIPELVPRAEESIVHKQYGDSFEATDLAELLAAHGTRRVLVTGAQTDACIRATLHGSLTRGYDTTLVADAHTTEDMRPWGSPISPEQAIAYANLYWSFTNAPGRTTEVVNAADLAL